MKKIFCYLLLLLLPVFSFAQINLNQGSIAQSSYFESISYENVNGKIIIPVTIDGIIYHFLFDTGASFAISKKLYDKIKTHLVGNINLSDANGAADNWKLISLAKLNIGKITFLNTPGMVFNKPTEKLMSCLGVDGIIGSNMLRNSILQINSKEKKIIFTNDVKKLSLRKKYSQELTTTITQSEPLIKILLKKGKEKASETLLFDTGDGSFYEMSVYAYAVFKDKTSILNTIAKSYGTYDWGMNGMASKQHQFLVNIPELILPKTSFKNVVATTTTDSSSRIGSKILKFGVVTVDYRDKLFYFRPFKDVSTDELSKRPWQISPTLANGKMVVGIIWDSALEKDVNLGDEIEQADGTAFSQMNFCQLVLHNSGLNANDDQGVLKLKDVKTGKIKTIQLSRM